MTCPRCKSHGLARRYDELFCLLCGHVAAKVLVEPLPTFVDPTEPVNDDRRCQETMRREVRAHELLEAGWAPSDIARVLDVSPRTVRRYLQSEVAA